MDAVEIETGPKPGAAVIWLHGLGADGHDFEPIVPELRLPKPVRFVFPHAPVRPVTINHGMRMRAWYDIFQFGGGPEDEAGIRASQELVEKLIEAEKQGKKIVLAGFSQGGAIVLQTALRHPERLAGRHGAVDLPAARGNAWRRKRSAANKDLPIFMAHGQLRRHHPDRPRASVARMCWNELGYPVTWQDYPMPHSVCARGDRATSRAFLL